MRSPVPPRFGIAWDGLLPVSEFGTAEIFTEDNHTPISIWQRLISAISDKVRAGNGPIWKEIALVRGLRGVSVGIGSGFGFAGSAATQERPALAP